MFINTKDLPGYGVEIFGYGHTDPDFDQRLSRVSQQDFLTQYIPDESKEKIFGHPPPFLNDEIELEVKKAIDKIGFSNRTFFQGKNHELALIAAERCLSTTGLLPSELDAIIVGTNTWRKGYPSLADHLKNDLMIHYNDGTSKALCFDMTEACTVGSIAVFNAYSLIKSGICETVLVVLSEKATDLADPKVWTEANLFGDAAGALLLTRSEKDSFIFFNINSLPSDGNLTAIFKNDEGFFKQDTKKVHRFVGGTVGEFLSSSLRQSSLTPEDVSHLISHQPSAKTLNFLEEYTKNKLPGLKGKLHWDIEGMGNTSSASTVVLISKLLSQGIIKRNEIVLVTTFGAGVSIGNYAFRY